MKAIAMTAAALCAMTAGAAAQDRRLALPTSLADERVLYEAPAPAAAEHEDVARFSLGPSAGYIKGRDADRGTWFGGIHARLHFLRILAAEASITFHQDEYNDGDVEVTQYPVQLTALLLPFGHSPVRPYALVGAGWYYTRFEYEGLFSLFEDETDRMFGVHVGAGLELDLGPSVFIFADFRWIFMDEPNTDNSQIEDEEFDSGQVTLGLSIRF
jgi:opacity protein-like surface antigen